MADNEDHSGSGELRRGRCGPVRGTSVVDDFNDHFFAQKTPTGIIDRRHDGPARRF